MLSTKRYCSFSVASQAKRLETQCHHYLFWHRHKRFRHQQKIIYCFAYTENEEAWLVQMQLANSNSMHTIHIYCSFVYYLQYKLDWGCLLRYLLYRLGKKSKTLRWLLLKIADCRKWKFMSFRWEMNAEFSDIDSKAVWRHRNACFSLRMADHTHYLRTHILVLAHPTHKCVAQL